LSYSSEYFDYDTKNKSFIDMYEFLKKRGIENNDFFLKLYDQKLVDVDPFDPDISEENIERIKSEISKNYWYYLREIARIPVMCERLDVGCGQYFMLHRGTLAQAWCFENNISHYLESSRQCYREMGVIQRYIWDFICGSDDVNSAIIDLSNSEAINNLNKLKKAILTLPKYLQPEYILNTNKIKRKNQNNIITAKSVHVRNDQEANKTETDLLVFLKNTHYVWINNFSFIRHNAIIHSAIEKYMHNLHKCHTRSIYITAIPGNIRNPYGKYAYDFIQKLSTFDEIIYDATEEQLFKYLQRIHNNIYIKYFFFELGRDINWFDEQCILLNYNWTTIRRELLLQWEPNDSPVSHEEIYSMIKERKENN